MERLKGLTIHLFLPRSICARQNNNLSTMKSDQPTNDSNALSNHIKLFHSSWTIQPTDPFFLFTSSYSLSALSILLLMVIYLTTKRVSHSLTHFRSRQKRARERERGRIRKRGAIKFNHCKKFILISVEKNFLNLFFF
jgi:hypothetical protein